MHGVSMKTFAAVFLSMLTLVSLNPRAVAHEPDDEGDESAEETVLTDDVIVDRQSYDLPGRQGKIYVSVRNSGHAMGFSHILEVRAHCEASESADWKKLDVDELDSFCAYQKGTITFDAKKQEVAARGFEPDGERYSADANKTPGQAEVHCKKTPKIFKLSVKELCPAPAKAK